MTVKQLKEQLIGIPEDAIIVCPGSDHSYVEADITATTAVKYSRREISEDFGDGYVEPGGKRINVLLVA